MFWAVRAVVLLMRVIGSPSPERGDLPALIGGHPTAAPEGLDLLALFIPVGVVAVTRSIAIVITISIRIAGLIGLLGLVVDQAAALGVVVCLQSPAARACLHQRLPEW